MSITIRVHQTHDTAGNPTPAEFVQAVSNTGTQSGLAAVWAFIEPLQPTPTSEFQSGMYHYHDPQRGYGWIQIEDVGMFSRDRLDQLVRLSQIERAIGQKDPVGGKQYAPAFPVSLTMSNPYGQITLGVIFLGMLLFFGQKVVTAEPPLPFVIVMILFGIILLAVSGYMLWAGFKRHSWWRKAREAALADGGPMPEDLKVFW